MANEFIWRNLMYDDLKTLNKSIAVGDMIYGDTDSQPYYELRGPEYVRFYRSNKDENLRNRRAYLSLTWNEYNGAIEVGEGTTTVQAKAIKQGLYNDSQEVSATYVVEIPVPELAMTPESMTISDAAAGVFTITGTNVNGNINANLTNTSDWYLNPETLSNTGGEVNVTYTGRELTAENTVNAYVANNPDVKASASVNYQTDI